MTKWTFATIALVTAAIVALIVWIRYDFGSTWAAAAIVIIAITLIGLLEWFKTLSTMRSTLNNWTTAQAADDKGEIERMRGLRAALGYDLKAATKSKPQDDDDDPWRDVTPLLAAPQTWTPAQLPAQTGGDVVYYDGN